MSKWNGRFWQHTLDQEITVGGSAVIGVLSANGADVAPIDEPKTWWVLVGIPLVIGFVKACIANAASGTAAAPSASLFSNSSNPG